MKKVMLGLIGVLLGLSTLEAQTLDQRYIGMYNPFSTDGVACTQAVLSAAAGNSASAGKSIIVSPVDVSRVACNWAITSNLSIALPRRLYIPPGANINISPGATLTACIDAGNYQIFGSTGAFVQPVNCGSEINASWWAKTQGGLTLADASAVASNTRMRISNGTWAISSGMTLSSLYRVDPGGLLSVSSGVTLANNTCPDAGVYKIFEADNSTSGLVTFTEGTCSRFEFEWWGDVADNSTDQTNNIHSAMAGIARGSELHFNPGRHKHSNLIIPKTLTLSGSTWSVHHRQAFASSNWDNITKTFRASLRCTATTGTCYSFTDGVEFTPFGMRDIMVLGPGTGTSDGVQFGGTTTGGILGKIDNVAIANFGGICFNQEYNNELHVDGLAVMGCGGDGIHIDETGGNSNWYRDFNIQAVGGDGIECKSAGRILFDGFSIQGVTGSAIKNNGCDETQYTNGYMEGNASLITHSDGSNISYNNLHASSGSGDITVVAGNAKFANNKFFGTVSLTITSGADVDSISTNYPGGVVDNNSPSHFYNYGNLSGDQIMHSMTLSAGAIGSRVLTLDSAGGTAGAVSRIKFKNTGEETAYLFCASDENDVLGYCSAVDGSTRERVILRDAAGANVFEDDTLTGVRYVTKDASTHAADARLANGIGYATYRKQVGTETDLLVLAKYKKSDGTVICTWLVLDAATKNGADFANSVPILQGSCP